MDIEAADIKFFIEDHSEGKCSVGVHPIKGQSVRRTVRYIPEDQRQTIVEVCTEHAGQVFDSWISTYETKRADLFNSLHAAPSRELVGQDMDEYLDREMLTALINFMGLVINVVMDDQGYELLPE